MLPQVDEELEANEGDQPGEGNIDRTDNGSDGGNNHGWVSETLVFPLNISVSPYFRIR